MKCKLDHSVLGRNVKFFRERMALKQEDLADYLGIKKETISRYENGRNIPLDKLEKLSDLFGVDLYDLFENDKSKKAFKIDELSPKDLKAIAKFRRIIKNYIKGYDLITWADDLMEYYEADPKGGRDERKTPLSDMRIGYADKKNHRRGL